MIGKKRSAVEPNRGTRIRQHPPHGGQIKISKKAHYTTYVRPQETSRGANWSEQRCRSILRSCSCSSIDEKELASASAVLSVGCRLSTAWVSSINRHNISGKDLRSPSQPEKKQMQTVLTSVFQSDHSSNMPGGYLGVVELLVGLLKSPARYYQVHY